MLPLTTGFNLCTGMSIGRPPPPGPLPVLQLMPAEKYEARKKAVEEVAAPIFSGLYGEGGAGAGAGAGFGAAGGLLGWVGYELREWVNWLLA